MAKKQKKVEVKRAPTKRQLAKWQRQQRTRHIVMLAGGIFFAFILIFVGYGYYRDQVKPFNQDIVRVNDTVFEMDYYISMLDIYSQGEESYMVTAMADVAGTAIEQNELIKQGAAGLGFSASDEEINSELGSLDLPDDEVYRDIFGVKLLVGKLLEEYFDPTVPVTSDQVQVHAMVLESKEVAEEVINKLGAGDNFTALAEEFSKEAVTKENGGDLGWLPEGLTGIVLGDLGDSLLEDIAFDLEAGMLSEPVYDESVNKNIGYWLIKVIERSEDKGSHAIGILLGSRHEAEMIKARLEAGEDFAVLAQEYSRHPESRDLEGELGWIQEGIGNEVVGEAAFALETGVLSEPIPDETVQTQGGYWLVEVLDKDADRLLEDETREKLKSKAFEDWLIEQRDKSSVENYLNEDLKSWAIARVLKNRE